MAKTLVCYGLSGGQGKTTVAFNLGKMLARHGKVLLIDADAQHNLTFFLGHEVQPTDLTLLEVIKEVIEIGRGKKQEIRTEEAIAHLGDNLWLIPADNALEQAQVVLMQSTINPSTHLRGRLEEIRDRFDWIVIDSPPARSHMSVTVLGAADYLVIPAEAQVKGVGSLMRTLELVNLMKSQGTFNAEILGVLPFRDRWVGRTRTKESNSNIEMMGEYGINVLPSIRESEKFKVALNEGKAIDEIDRDLAYPFEAILELLGVNANV